MALSTDDIYGKAVGLSADVEDNFLELGRCLRQLQDRDLEMFQKVVNKTNSAGARRIILSRFRAPSTR